jgi:hypothetical protein
VFWSSTVKELVREFVVAAARARAAHDRDLRLAWSLAALSRTKRLPKLEQLLARRNPQGQTPREMAGVLEQLSAQYGMPLRRHPLVPAA